MRTSARAAWDLRPNALSLRLAERRRAGGEILDLSESNPTRAGIDYPAEEIREALSDGRVLAYEPAPLGLPEARAAVAAYYAGRGHGVSPERILLTASTSEAYSYLFKLLCDPGDRVLVPAPSYPLFEFLATLEGVRPEPYPLRYADGWEIDLERLRALATSETRAIIVVSPNNPTGSFLKHRELAALREIAASSGAALIADEVFGDYAFGTDPERVATLAEEEEMLSFALSGLSKVAGLPQIKAGWVVVSGPRAEAALSRLELIADTFLSVSTPAQVALPRLLSAGARIREGIRRRLAENDAVLRAALSRGSACSRLAVEGGWYATLRLPRTRAEEEWVLSLLGDRGVLVHPGHFFDFPAEPYVVLSLLTAPPVFREGVARLVDLVG
jgi:aspartate/methionine/tyrosine aminotransferase